MKRFAHLLTMLSETTSTTKKVELLEEYFRSAPADDGSYAVYILSGGTIPRRVTTTMLRELVVQVSGHPMWLVEESYHIVGDLAETVSLLVSGASKKSDEDQSLSYWIERITSFDRLSVEERGAELIDSWETLSRDEVLVVTKLITGALRVGVSKGLVVKALAKVSGVSEDIVAHRLSGTLELLPDLLTSVLHYEQVEGDSFRPYPFYLAYPVTGQLEALGSPSEWAAEWKWDGIRGQLITRPTGIALWSRGEELVTERFPEIEEASRLLPPNLVLDGEILGWSNDAPLPFGELQKRITRLRITPQIKRAVPVKFLAYDIVEYEGVDIRTKPWSERRKLLEDLLPLQGTLSISELVRYDSWDELTALRPLAPSRGAEGLMLKHKASPYGVGRRRGEWWKWKVDPYTIDAVLVYAQKGHGRRAELYTDYTFAVWQEGSLVPFAKAYSGLTDKEIREVDGFIKKNTLERFGPVRTVKPELVFELAFEGIQLSKRHKSGVAVRFPRILRWRKDKPYEEADTIDNLRRLLTARAA